jgi:hypothetical protein
MQNLSLKTPYKFKKSNGGTAEPQTTQQDAPPWLHGPSLKKVVARFVRIEASDTASEEASVRP